MEHNVARTTRRGPWWYVQNPQHTWLRPERYGKQMGSGKRAEFRFRDGWCLGSPWYAGHSYKPALITDGVSVRNRRCSCCQAATARFRNHIRRKADRGAIRDGLRDYENDWTLSQGARQTSPAVARTPDQAGESPKAPAPAGAGACRRRSGHAAVARGCTFHDSPICSSLDLRLFPSPGPSFTSTGSTTRPGGRGSRQEGEGEMNGLIKFDAVRLTQERRKRRLTRKRLVALAGVCTKTLARATREGICRESARLIAAALTPDPKNTEEHLHGRGGHDHREAASGQRGPGRLVQRRGRSRACRLREQGGPDRRRRYGSNAGYCRGSAACPSRGSPGAAGRDPAASRVPGRLPGDLP